MFNKEILIADLKFENKILRDKVKAFESGEKYARMDRERKEIIRYYEKKLKSKDSELARAHAETISVRDKWFKTCEDILFEKEKAIKAANKEIEKYKALALLAYKKRDEALDKCKAKNKELYEVKILNEDAMEKINALIGNIKKDYTNSSKSSSMNPNHKKIHNNREISGKRPGGQPGHIHHPRKYVKPTKTVVIPPPDKYTYDDNYQPTGKFVRKELIKISFSAEVIEYVTREFRNLQTGQRVHAQFPKGIKDDVTYDGSVKAAVYLLNNYCNTSKENTRIFLNEISGGSINVSNGFITNVCKEFSDKTREERHDIFMRMVSSEVMNSDFTFGRQSGKQGSVLVCATKNDILYQSKPKKGHEGVKDSPVEVYQGTIISDHESTFLSYGTRHQECLGHVERYLRGSMENEPEREWNYQMFDWVREAIHLRNQAVNEGYSQVSQADELEEKYTKIINKAKEEYEYIPPGKYYKDGYNLYKRLAEDKSSYCLFLHDTSVEPTNNRAERAARKFKRKAAQVMTFRSESGMRYFCDGLSVIQTLRMKGSNLYEEIKNIFNKDLIEW